MVSGDLGSSVVKDGLVVVRGWFSNGLGWLVVVRSWLVIVCNWGWLVMVRGRFVVVKGYVHSSCRII